MDRRDWGFASVTASVGARVPPAARAAVSVTASATASNSAIRSGLTTTPRRGSCSLMLSESLSSRPDADMPGKAEVECKARQNWKSKEEKYDRCIVMIGVGKSVSLVVLVFMFPPKMMVDCHVSRNGWKIMAAVGAPEVKWMPSAEA